MLPQCHTVEASPTARVRCRRTVEVTEVAARSLRVRQTALSVAFQDSCRGLKSGSECLEFSVCLLGWCWIDAGRLPLLTVTVYVFERSKVGKKAPTLTLPVAACHPRCII